MPLASSSYQALVSEAIVQQLADSANFQAANSVVTAAAAKAFIVEDTGGSDDDADGKFYATDNSLLQLTSTPPAMWAVVRLGESRRVERAFLTWGNEGDAMIMLIIAAQTGDKPAEQIRRARNQGGLIAADMQALFGQATTRIASGMIDVGEVSVADEAGAMRGALLVPLKFTWKDIP